jgi:hypothetical protein
VRGQRLFSRFAVEVKTVIGRLSPNRMNSGRASRLLAASAPEITKVESATAPRDKERERTSRKIGSVVRSIDHVVKLGL